MQTLVVDDSGVVRNMMVRALRALQIHQVSEAADGLAAWQLFRERSFDLLLLDRHMPRMDGVELTRKIREVNSNVTIIMVSVVNSKAMILESIHAGVSDYLLKPFTRKELEDKIVTWFGKETNSGWLGGI